MISKTILKLGGSYLYPRFLFLATHDNNGRAFDYFSSFTCRERFHGYMPVNRKKLFSIASLCSIYDIDKFFSALENELNIPKKDQTIFYRTNIKHVYTVELSKFWRKNLFRFQLSTIFLRAGGSNKYCGLMKTIRKENLARDIRSVIKLFLSGYTYLDSKQIKLNHLNGVVSRLVHYNGDLKSVLRKNARLT